MKVIELKNIKKVYYLKDLEVPVLRDINLEIMQGEFVAIVGQSGSGKSTLLNILGLLDKPSEGCYKLAGMEISNRSDEELSVIRSRYLGFIFQQFNLLPRLTIQENVSLPIVYSTGYMDSHEDPLKLLSMVGLSDRLKHKPNEISGGQQQRVAIVRALVNKPSIILADEPTGNLDTKSAKEIVRILKDLNNIGITVIMVTHEPEIASYATRIVKIQDGAIIDDKTRIPVKCDSSRKLDSKTFKYKTFSFLKIKNCFVEAIRSIMYNKTRSILSILSVVMGIVSLISILAISGGVRRNIEKQIASLGSNVLVISPGVTKSGGVYYKKKMGIGLESKDVDDLKKNVSEIKSITGYVFEGFHQVSAGGKNYNTTVEGVSTGYQDIENSYPSIGRFFTDIEDKENKKVVLLGKTVLKKIYGSENFNPVGNYLKIDDVDFQVIGVLPTKGVEGWRDGDNRVVIPLNTAMRRIFGIRNLFFIAAQIKDGVNIDRISEIITRRILFTHRIPFYRKKDAVEIKSAVKFQEMARSTNRTFSFLIVSIAFISLLVGGIGIMNVMFASVSERTKEIGLRKALGANKTDILLQFIIESIFICCIGGVIGIVLGWGGTVIIINKLCNQLFRIEAYVTYFSVIFAFCFSVLTGLIFAIWPARKASLLNPIDALRHD